MNTVPQGHLFSQSPPISPDFQRNFSKYFEFPELENHTKKRTCCSFCYNLYKKNCEKEGEKKILSKDEEGPWSFHPIAILGKITCPMLWFHKCQICGATGDSAHTEKHCKNSKI
ncbi:unnamed protein product [Caenorhabditis angaria]|uniref:Nanos-type domain-containing protein n=1 Tax=Caenorhabditis angaria TaxID=860376 RepID=A0A9P1N729_9PELO|nr:unnamed protein product [Caenorhabditis angaria]